MTLTRLVRGRPLALLLIAALALGVVGAAPGPSVGAEAAPEGGWLVATPLDLGTLGGDYSTAAAIDGDLVVGYAQTERGAFHAYVLDLGSPEPRPVDLGTLGGRQSAATDVSGNVVVGHSKTGRPRDGYHLFAYDLSDPATGMIDLGPKGGSEYGDPPGPFVDDGLIAGQIAGRRSGSRTIAFSYDMHAARPRVVRYGTLGGWSSAAFAVQGGVLVGFAQVPGDSSRAFAVHARAADPEMVPLGPPDVASSALDVDDGLVVGHYYSRIGPRAVAFDLNGPEPALKRLGGGVGSATAVDEGVVVGAASPSGPTRPAVFDLQSTDAPVVDLGTLGGWGKAVDVDDITVVGYTYGPVGGLRAFADDLTDDDAMTDLGVLPGYATARPTDVDAGLVIGQMGAAYDPRAVLWRLERSSEPRLRFTAMERVVEEEQTWSQ